jgi:hypothetical protein
MSEPHIDLHALLEAGGGIVGGTLVDAGMQRQFERHYKYSKSGDFLTLKPRRGSGCVTLPARLSLTRATARTGIRTSRSLSRQKHFERRHRVIREVLS